MKRILIISLTLILFFFKLEAQRNQVAQRTVVNFDNDWLFLNGETQGAENPEFDDSTWRKLNVPHDWSIEGAYSQENPTTRGGGYLPAGIGWYRKRFTIDMDAKNRKYFIEFDGVMANSDVWINGIHLGKRPYGYSGFSYDITNALRTGKTDMNVIAVRCDNSVQPASRYYAGAGIYRHVRLVRTSPVHYDQWGLFVYASDVSSGKATLNIQASIKNDSGNAGEFFIETTVSDPSGKIVATVQDKVSVPAGSSIESVKSVVLASPVLWDMENPVMYNAISRVKQAKNITDELSADFGIRDSRFEAATGYWINGKNLKIKGVCLHHDAGGLGAAVPLRAWEKRLELLKAAGVNAIRTGHNPFAPEFYDLCDRLGFLVMDESFDTWNAAKPNGEKGYNLHFTEWWDEDIKAMVMRDRNHPSIIIYSIGNEIRDNLNDPSGFKKYKDQQDLVHQLDPSRPVTMALFRPNSSKVYSNGFAEMMDIVGQNYREQELVDYHKANPHRPVIGTENGHGLNEWLILRDNPFMSGQFLWIGIDYLGEALWPSISFSNGLFDRTGEWKQLGLQRQSWWSEKPVVHIVRRSDNAGAGEWVSDWTPVDEGTYDNSFIEIYSNCDEVELFLNDKSQGRQPKPADDSPRKWNITWESGTIRATGINDGKIVASEEHHTAGPPVSVSLKADRNAISASPDDIVYVTASVTDENDIICPNTDRLVRFTISGPGEILAVDNGNTTSHEMYKASERTTYKGKCVAIIRARDKTGKITVNASCGDLREGVTVIEIRPDQR